MSLTPKTISQYHIFLASPGDVSEERQSVRQFFEQYNRTTAHLWSVQFVVVDWENYATTGIGRPQELITQQTLERFRDSLALVVGIMGQRCLASSPLAVWRQTSWPVRAVAGLAVVACDNVGPAIGKLALRGSKAFGVTGFL